MIQSRDLILARWVLQFRKVPKIAVAEALRSTQLKRDQGVQTSLAKMLVEHGWLSISDLREIVARASQEAYVCSVCGRRYALPSSQADYQPPCPECGGALSPDRTPAPPPQEPKPDQLASSPKATARKHPRFQWDESDERPPKAPAAPEPTPHHVPPPEEEPRLEELEELPEEEEEEEEEEEKEAYRVTSDPDLEQHTLVNTDERVVQLESLLRSSETGERPAAEFPETLADPLGGDLVTGSVSGRMMLELTSWSNVTEFLGVDVPAMDLSSTAACLPALDADAATAAAEIPQAPGPTHQLSRTGEVPLPVSRRQAVVKKLRQPAVLAAAACLLLVTILGTARILTVRRIRTLEQATVRALSQDDWRLASDLLDELTELTSQHPDVILQRGQLALRMRRMDQALADAQSVIDARPRDAEAHALKARVLASRGKLNESLKSFETAAKLGAESLAEERQATLVEDAAWTALVAGDPAKALNWADQVLKQDPRRGSAAVVVGWLRLAADEPSAAASALAQVPTGGTPLVPLLRARASLLQAAPEAALADLTCLESADLDPALAALAARLRAQARIRLSLPTARRAGALPASPPFPDQAATLLNQALADLDQAAGRREPTIGALIDLAAPSFLRGRTREATAAETAVLLSGADRTSSNSETLLRGLALEGLGRIDEALEAAGAACENNPEDPNSLALHTRLELARQGLHPLTKGILKRRRDPVTVTASERQALKLAEERYTAGLRLPRRDKLWDVDRIRKDRGEVRLLLGQVSEATEDARQAGASGDKSLDLILFTADAWLEMGTSAMMAAALPKASTAKPDQPAVALRRIQLMILKASSGLGSDQDLLAAERHLADLLRNPDCQLPPLKALQGSILLRRSSTQRAIALLEEATREDTTLARAYLDLADAHRREGNISRSLDGLRLASLAAPLWIRPYTDRARLLESQGKLKEAADAYDEALLIAPGNDEIHLRRLLLADELDPPELVLKQVRRADESAGSAEVLKFIHLRALARVGRVAEARDTAKTLDEIDPSGRLRDLGKAMVIAWQQGRLDKVPAGYWYSISKWLTGVDEIIAEIPNHRGGREIRAMYLDLVARALEVSGDIELSKDKQEEARRLRQAGHQQGVQ